MNISEMKNFTTIMLFNAIKIKNTAVLIIKSIFIDIKYEFKIKTNNILYVKVHAIYKNIFSIY